MKHTLLVACTTLLTFGLYAGDFPLADAIKDSQWAHINAPVNPADAWTLLSVWDGPTSDKITQPQLEQDESIDPHDISITTIIKHFAPTQTITSPSQEDETTAPHDDLPWIAVSSHIKASKKKKVSGSQSLQTVQSIADNTLPAEDPLDVYAIKRDNKKQQHRNHCYHASYHKSQQHAAYVAHILYKRSDINPPRNVEIAQVSSASNPSKLLPSNRSPQETLKEQHLRGNNTTQITNVNTNTRQPLLYVPIPLMSAVIAAHVAHAAHWAHTMQSDTAQTITTFMTSEKLSLRSRIITARIEKAICSSDYAQKIARKILSVGRTSVDHDCLTRIVGHFTQNGEVSK
jgi:hypothetical protein